MKIIYLATFTKDLSKLKDRSLTNRIANALSKVDAAKSLHDISQVKKLEGSANNYRLRVGDYRLLFVEVDDSLIFKSCLHRSTVYKRQNQ